MWTWAIRNTTVDQTKREFQNDLRVDYTIRMIHQSKINWDTKNKKSNKNQLKKCKTWKIISNHRTPETNTIEKTGKQPGNKKSTESKIKPKINWNTEKQKIKPVSTEISREKQLRDREPKTRKTNQDNNMWTKSNSWSSKVRITTCQESPWDKIIVNPNILVIETKYIREQSFE